MSNQMLEDYVVEARALREQVGVLARIAKILWDTTSIYEISVAELLETEPLPVMIKDGVAYLGPDGWSLDEIHDDTA